MTDVLMNPFFRSAELYTLGQAVQNPTAGHFEQSLLTQLLRNALGGHALTLLFGCISPSDDDENMSETRDTLNFAQKVTKIKNSPVPNVSQINNEFLNDSLDELSYINSSSNNRPNPNAAMVMPDLINPEQHPMNYMLQQMQLMPPAWMQQQMLSNYMMQMMLQQVCKYFFY